MHIGRCAAVFAGVLGAVTSLGSTEPPSACFIGLVAYAEHPTTGHVAAGVGEPPAKLEGEFVRELPCEVEQVQVAGDGRYLVMRLSELPAVAVFDTFALQMKYIRLPQMDFTFGAGGDTLVVYLPGQNLLQSYDLLTGQRRKAKPNPFGVTVLNIVMGYGRADCAVVRYADRTDETSRASLAQLDTARLERVDLPTRTPALIHHSTYRDLVNLRANRDLSVIVDRSSRREIITLRGTAYERYASAAGSLSAGDDGRIYTTGGRILDDTGREIAHVSENALYPGLGGTLCLGCAAADGQLTLYAAGQTKPLATLGTFPDWSATGEIGEQLARGLPDPRVVFLPLSARIILFPVDNRHIVVRPFDLQRSLDSAGDNAFIVRSVPPREAAVGQPWAYQVEVFSRAATVTYVLELGPPGMALSSTGRLTWTPTEVPRHGGETVLLRIKDAAGEEIYHKFTVLVHPS